MKKESKLRVGVIFGGMSGEYEVSLMSARSVLSALDPEKYEIHQIGITNDGAWLTGEDVIGAFETGSTENLLAATMLPETTHHGLFRVRKTSRGRTLENLIPLDVVFPVLHGTYGEDGAIQGLLELEGAAYVGAGVLGSALGMDKGVFHDLMRAQGIPVVQSLVLTRREIEQDIDSAIGRVEAALKEGKFSYPLFTKPANLGSSVGITKCRGRSDLLEGLHEAARFDRRIVVERGVDAREIEVAVLGNDEPQASMPGEIIPSREFYSYEAKYIDGTSSLLIPAPIPEETAENARRWAVQAFKAADCAGMARVDYFLDKDSGELFLSEINTIPGFTSISMYPKLWEASGLPYAELLDRLIELALERKAEKDRLVRRYQQS